MSPPIRENLTVVRSRIAAACAKAGRDAEGISLIAVTKRHGPEILEEALGEGLLDLGENRVQELLEKLPRFEGRARFHLIGQLQSNKVNKVVGRVAAIHSVDRAELLDRIGRRAGELELTQPIFLQVNVSGEAQKGGCDPGEAAELWERAKAAPSLLPLGLMTMAAAGLDESATREQFARLRTLAEPHSTRDGTPLALSMGMSADFEWALAEGATHLRLGTILVGERPG